MMIVTAVGIGKERASFDGKVKKTIFLLVTVTVLWRIQ
jgi:hypothetical protein